MQPYFFPYIGYFQLVNYVDRFVLFDDVHYRNKGFIDRNTILMNGSPHSIKLQLRGASQNKLIKEIELGDNGRKLIETVRHGYKRAEFFSKFFPVLEQILECERRNLSSFLLFLIQKITSYLDIRSEILRSSDIDLPHAGKDKIIPMVKALGGTTYVNMIAGADMYSCAEFEREGLELRFLKPQLTEYPQLSKTFCPTLSIIDLLMNVDVRQAGNIVKNPEIILR